MKHLAVVSVCKILAFEVGIRLKSMSVVSDLWLEVNDLKPLRGPQSFDMVYNLNFTFLYPLLVRQIGDLTFLPLLIRHTGDLT